MPYSAAILDLWLLPTHQTLELTQISNQNYATGTDHSYAYVKERVVDTKMCFVLIIRWLQLTRCLYTAVIPCLLDDIRLLLLLQHIHPNTIANPCFKKMVLWRARNIFFLVINIKHGRPLHINIYSNNFLNAVCQIYKQPICSKIQWSRTSIAKKKQRLLFYNFQWSLALWIRLLWFWLMFMV